MANIINYNTECSSYLQSNNIYAFNPSYDKKTVLKSLAHMVPTYALSDNSNIEMRKSCTLPNFLSGIYQNIGNRCSITNNFGSTNLSTNNSKDIQNGCVLAFQNTTDNVYDKVYTQQSDIQNQIYNLGITQDYSSYEYIRLLEEENKNLRISLSNLQNITLPQKRAAAEAAHISLSVKELQCQNIEKASGLSNNKVIALEHMYNNEATQLENENNIRQISLYEKYLTSNVDYLIRNCRELSYIRVYEHVGYGGKSIMIPKANIGSQITRDNVFTPSEWSMGRYDIPDIRTYYSDNTISSIRMPPGIYVTTFEHFNFAGASMSYSFNTANDLTNTGFNDIISSIYIYGGFKSGVVLDTPQIFSWKLQNLSSTAPQWMYDTKLYTNIYTTANSAGGNGGGPFNLQCPSGTYVSSFNNLRSGWHIDQLGLACSDGSVLTPKGGLGGSPTSDVISADGFKQIQARSGSYLNRITFYGPNRQWMGTYGRDDGPNTILDCGDGKIVGIAGRSGALIDKLQVICGK